MRLLDANLLIYASDQSSPHHAQTRAWLDGVYEEDTRVLIPEPSILAFLRITTNPRVMKKPLSPEQAIGWIDILLQHPKTSIPLRGSRHWENFSKLVISAQAKAHLIPDAFLAALALDHGATVCSHDTDFKLFDGVRWENPLDAPQN
jgi:toxin-antitoxin system PIN domain toxin